MKARNFDLLNQTVEKIWDCESFLRTFELFRDEGLSLTDELFCEFRNELVALRVLCIRMA